MYNKLDSNEIITIFVITALWDVALRFVVEGKIPLSGIEDMKWIVVLKGYFKRHTLLGAALIAGFVGAVTEVLLQRSVYTWYSQNTKSRGLAVLLVSGLIGLPMRYSGLFPHLEEHYYKPLGFQYSFCTDVFSGLVVMITHQFLTINKILANT